MGLTTGQLGCRTHENLATSLGKSWQRWHVSSKWMDSPSHRRNVRGSGKTVRILATFPDAEKGPYTCGNRPGGIKRRHKICRNYLLHLISLLGQRDEVKRKIEITV